MSPAKWYARQLARSALSQAEARAASGQVELALVAFDRAAKLEPRLQKQTLQSAAALLTLHHRPAEAVSRLEALVALDPKNAESWRLLARALQGLGEGDRAFRAWERLLEIDPANVEAHGQLADLLQEQGFKASAVVHLRAVAKAGVDPAAWRRLAETLADLSQTEEAIAAWRRVLAMAPGDRQAHVALAALLGSRPAEAVPHLRVLAAETPKKPEVWRALGRALAQLGDAPGSIEAWRRVVRFEAEDLEAHAALADLLASRKAAALPHLEVLAKTGPDPADAGRRLADLLIRTGDKAAARTVLERLVEEDAGDGASRQSLAQVLTDLGLNGEAAVHLRLIAEGARDDIETWRRLARVLRAAADADGEAKAWRQALAIDENDLQAHERLADLLSEAGRTAEAATHLKAVIQIAPQNTKAWRRYVRARRQSGDNADDLTLWREVLAFAGQGDLEAQLKHAQEAVQRAQTLKQELQAAGAELKRERGATQHALTRLEREERAHNTAQELLKEELAERRRLTLELQESTQRRGQAEAEEARHLLAGRLLGLLEPLSDAEVGPSSQELQTSAYVQETLRAVAQDGALVVAREPDAALSAVRQMAPGDIPAGFGRRSSKLIVLTDGNPAARAEIRASLADRANLTVLGLDELMVRRAAAVAEFTSPIEPVSDDVWPPRPLMIMCADDGLGDVVVDAISKATDLRFAPLFPMDLAARVRAREIDIDDWLAAAWSAQGRPRAFGFRFDPETLTLFAREIRSGRAKVMAKVFRRATALQLVWSDKALHAAVGHFARAGGAGADFDSGDAQIELKTYKRLIARDMMLESAFDQLGKFKPSTVKAYRELFDKQALGRFCRDAGLSLAVAGFAEAPERALGFMPAPEVVRAGRLIAEAVEARTAAREPEAPPQGLLEYGLARSLQALGRHAEARQAYQEAMLKAPTYFPARSAASRYLELSGRTAEAEHLLREGLGNGTPGPDVQDGLLEFYQRNSSPSEVAAISRMMAKRGLSRPAIMAPALIELGRWKQAEPLLDSLSKRIAGQDTFLSDLLDLPALARRLPALESEAGEGGAAAQLNLAEALRRLGRLQDALPFYRRAMADPSVMEAETGVSPEVWPRFLMVGPPRTGTTLLRRLFELHPQIATPSGELFFFSSRTGQRAGSNRQRAPLAWYLRAFKDAAEHKPEARIAGEKTPHYFSTSDEQMAFASLLLPKVKLIVTLRDPVERAWSEIKVQRKVAEAEIIASLGVGGAPNWLEEILDAGRYVAHLKRWLKHLGPEQLLLVDSAALETNVADEAARIFRWLGVAQLGRRQVTELKQGWDNRSENLPAGGALKDRLQQYYGDESFSVADIEAKLWPKAP